MDRTEFESELSADGYREVVDRHMQANSVNPGHAHDFDARLLIIEGEMTVASGGEDAEIRIWNPDADGKQLRELVGFGGTVFRLRYSPDGQVLVACSGGKSVHVYKASGGLIRKLPGHQDWIYSLAISRDSKTIATGSWDGEVRLWNIADGKPIRNFIAAPGYKPSATTKAAAR